MDIKALGELIVDTRKTLEATPEGFYASLYASYGLKFLDAVWALINSEQEEPKNHIRGLKKLLAQNFEFIKGTTLCYTAIPNHPITQFCSALATYLADDANPPLAILMPGVALVPTDGQHYPDFEEVDIPLKTILSQHILGRNHRYLVPIKLLTHIDVLTDDYPNMYFDTLDQTYNSLNPDAVKALLTLNKDEVERLFHHSGATEQLAEAKATYAALASDESHFFGKLNALIRALKQASANGTGLEELSGTCFALTAQDFFTFYGRLDDKLKAKIPGPLTTEVKLLKQYFTGEREYDEGSCFATRADALVATSRGHEALLASIKLEGETASQLLAEAKVRFEESQRALRAALANDDEDELYHGEDKLPLTQHLLEKLNVALTLDDEGNITQFINRLKPEDVHLLITGQVKQQLIAKLNSAEDATMFLLLTKPDQLKELFPIIGRQLIHAIRESHETFRFVGETESNTQLYACLSILSLERQAIVFDHIDINEFDTLEHSTLLTLAAKDGNLEMVRTLLDRGAAIDSLNGFQETALYCAAQAGHLEIVKLLLDRGANSNIQCKRNGTNPMHAACSTGNIAIIELLLAKGDKACLNQENDIGNTPLIVATMHLKYDCAKFLLRHGALVNRRNTYGGSAMLIAASEGNWPLVDELIANGANIHHLDNRQQGLIYHAAYHGAADRIDRYAELGLSVNQKTSDDESPLLMAALNHHPQTVSRLLSYGADNKATNGWGFNALQLACFARSSTVEKAQTIISLISHGTLVEETVGYNAGPLFSQLPKVFRNAIPMYLEPTHLTSLEQMRLLANSFPYSEHQEAWVGRYKDLLRLEKETLAHRRSEYHYYGLFSYFGANSKRQEINAINHFVAWLDGDKTKLTDLDRTVLSRGHLAPLTQGFNLLTNGDFLSANPTPPPLRISIA